MDYVQQGNYWHGSIFDYVKGKIRHDDKLANGDVNENRYATNRMPLWIKPDKKVKLEDMFEFMRDHLQGTELDMSKDLALSFWPSNPLETIDMGS